MWPIAHLPGGATGVAVVGGASGRARSCGEGTGGFGVSVCGGGGRTPWWFGHGRALPDAPRMVVVVVVGRRGGVSMGAACRTRLGWWWV